MATTKKTTPKKTAPKKKSPAKKPHKTSPKSLENLKKGTEARRSASYENTGQKKTWTKAKAVKLGNDLIEWLENDDTHMFFKEYLLLEEKLHPRIISYLTEQYPEFAESIEKAKQIQELKLVKWGTLGKLSSSMTKFTLTNNHGWTERARVETVEPPRTEDDYEDDFDKLLDPKKKTKKK